MRDEQDKEKRNSRVGAEDGDDKADGIGDKVSGDLNVPIDKFSRG